MVLYGRTFSLRQALKLPYIVGVSSGPLLFGALRKGPRTGFEFAWRSLELFKTLTSTGPLPVTTLGNLGASDEKCKQVWIDLSEPSPSMPPGELALLCSLVKWGNPETVVEIGTYRGFTTLHLSRNTSDTCHIFTVDLPPEVGPQIAAQSSDPQMIAEAAISQRAFTNDRKITQILQDSTTVDWATVVGRQVDFALIDGSHLYDHVRGDTERILEVLSPRGMVVWHDYQRVEVRRGVGKYLAELRRSGLPIFQLQGTTMAVYVRGV